MSSAATINSKTSDKPRYEATFLGIAAELRNSIYEYAFFSEIKRGVAPHALTRVNKQIREETLEMYFESNRVVETLVVPLHTYKQLSHSEQWVDAEQKCQTFPKRPDVIQHRHNPEPHYPSFEFHFTPARGASAGQKVKLCFMREEFSPSDELKRMVPRTLNQDILKRVHQALHYCVGFDAAEFEQCMARRPFQLTLGNCNAFRNSGRWVTRQVKCEGFLERDKDFDEIFVFWRDRAMELRGAEWDTTFLEHQVAWWFEFNAKLLEESSD